MEKKLYLKKILAVCLCLIFTWASVAVWFFTYEIAGWIHWPKEFVECAAIVIGCFGLSFSCVAYEANGRDAEKD